MNNIGKRISRLMRQYRLSQKDLAAKVGVTESAISYYVQGKRVPRSDVLTRMANALNTTTDYLLGYSEKPLAEQTQNELQYLQRNLGKLDAEQLKKAENILKTVFDDIFDDDEDEE